MSGKRYNDGMIYTNDKCVGCNRCVHICPTLGANVSTRQNGKISIDVSDLNCIHCGRCVPECIHGARQIKDDTEEFLESLKNGEDVSILVDPAFYLPFGDDAEKIFGYLKSIGVKGIYDASIGGGICMYEHVKYLKENMDEDGNCDKFLSHNCSGVSNYTSKYFPKALEYFIPVQVPNVCAAIYYKKYHHVTGKFALLTPCSAVRDEFSNSNSGRSINFLIGLKSLKTLIKDVNLDEYYSEIDYKYDGIGMAFIEAGNFSDAVASFFPPTLRFKTYKGLGNNIDRLFNSKNFYVKGVHPFMDETTSCNWGCVNGPSILVDGYNVEDGISKFSDMFRTATKLFSEPDNAYKEKYERLCEKYGYIRDDDFRWEPEENHVQRCKIPDDVMEEIYAAMYKDTDVKKHFDCGACGHKSCNEMVIAIAYGYSKIEDCVHYMNDEIKVQFGVDPMTGLMNRRAFINASEERIRADRTRNYVLVIGDINGLGGINDLYDNAGGDAIIKYVADVVRDYCAGREGICARLGGGSYGICIPHSQANMDAFKEISVINIEHLGIEYPLSLKYGIYRITDHDILMSKAIMYATYAYRNARDHSRNSYTLYTEQMSEEMLTEAEVTQKMRKAKDNNEFVLFLQPKYDHLTGKLAGGEVLSRWIKSDGAMVSPGIFIPVFEKNGFVSELDRYVWDSSFALIDRWIEQKKDIVPISVNVSRISLTEDDVIEYIDELDKKYPRAKQYIQFEITESAYVRGVDIFSKIQKIRNMGFLINMDDFGSGYSSLNVLKDAPIDVLKLDMGFLRGEENVERGNIIISSMVDMAQKLGFRLVAEGVETKEQADMLTDMGCNIIQGYFYAKPMPISEFEALFRTER